MYCPACGSKADVDDRFCQNCGSPLPERIEHPLGDPSSPAREPAAGVGDRGDDPSPWRIDPYPTANPASSRSVSFPGTPPGQAPPWAGTSTIAGPPLSPFGAPLASWWQRVGASLLDDLIVVAPLGIVIAILNRAFGTLHVVGIGGAARSVRTIQGAPHIAIYVVSALIIGVYLSVLNGTGNGQTIGNRAPGIAVRDVNTGEVIGLKRGAIRWFVRTILYAAFIVPGLLSDLFPLWDRRRQTLADKAARSVVIRVR